MEWKELENDVFLRVGNNGFIEIADQNDIVGIPKASLWELIFELKKIAEGEENGFHSS